MALGMLPAYGNVKRKGMDAEPCPALVAIPWVCSLPIVIQLFLYSVQLICLTKSIVLFKSLHSFSVWYEGPPDLTA